MAGKLIIRWRAKTPKTGGRVVVLKKKPTRGGKVHRPARPRS